MIFLFLQELAISFNFHRGVSVSLNFERIIFQPNWSAKLASRQGGLVNIAVCFPIQTQIPIFHCPFHI